MFDVKEKINEIVDKIKKDPKQMEKFKKNPIEAIEKLLGVDLPDNITEQVVSGVKAKLSGDKLSGALDSLKKLF